MGKKRNKGQFTKWQQLIYIMVGSFIVALAYNGFLLPNYVAAGGVSGISTITEALLGIEPAYVIWAINIPLLFVAYYLLGRGSAFRSLAGSLLLPLFVFLTRHMDAFVNDALLAALFGGLGVGVGIGIVFLGDASTGGTALIAQLINKFTNLTLGSSIAIIDGIIVVTAIIVFDIELGLYALIGLYMTSKSIDLVQTGFNKTKTTLIVSNEYLDVQEAIYTRVDRGVTRLAAQGGFTQDERPVLMCVVYQSEMGALKRTIREVDPEAFVIVTDSAEVLGQGFYESA
ncbi:YitT family protein [Halalkalibacillus halophilus]|uniref:YitT family protein n=1 Tax=Halalkalibacillus halophilus TaxID=392827 RepID=UPI0003FC7D5C|nr:YitT family protein [Halalkalibacillus halophilus]